MYWCNVRVKRAYTGDGGDGDGGGDGGGGGSGGCIDSIMKW